MKKTFKSTFSKHGVGFLLALSTICSVIPQPVLADYSDVLKWTQIDKPGSIGSTIVHPSEVSKIAVSTKNVIYALDYFEPLTPAPPPPHPNRIFRSQKGGTTWDDITSAVINSGANRPFSTIAVAPDDPSIVALVTGNGVVPGLHVYLSTDGGGNWFDTGVPSLSGSIQCIAISKVYFSNGNKHDIAIGTAQWKNGTTDGQVWCSQLGGVVSGWQNQFVSVTTHLPTDPPASATKAEVSAITFSPDYGNDGGLLVVASTAADVAARPEKTLLCVGIRDLVAQNTKWNNIINYPREITGAKGDDPNVTKIISSITLPSDYYAGGTLTSMIAFFSFNRRSTPAVTDANDVYRYITQTNDLLRLINAAGGSGTDISSVALYGTGSIGSASGKLLAGDYSTSNWPFIQVRLCLNPFDLPPSSPGWSSVNQFPTGPGNAQVAWSSDGTAAYCGTSRNEYSPWGVGIEPFPDESAFSQSLDNGNNWQQVGLIDTTLRICDIAPSPDSKSLFLGSYDLRGLEWVWRSAGDPLGMFWGRIFGLNTGSDRIILRLSSNYDQDNTIYAAEQNGPVCPDQPCYIGVSHDRGNYWAKYYIPPLMIDMVAANSKTVYIALPGGAIRKTTNEGAIWQAPVKTGLDTINMLNLTKNGHLFVGSRDNKVAYSTDGGTTFIEIPQPVGNHLQAGDVQVISDSQYTKNNTIYAATTIADFGVWRWKIGASTLWEQIDKTVTDLPGDEQFSGLAMGEEGTLYALRLEPSNPGITGGMNRSLNPNEPQTVKIEWDVINRTLPGPLANPPTVSIRFDPTLLPPILPRPIPPAPMPIAVVPPAPALISPLDGSKQSVTSINFQWNPSVGATKYWLQVYKACSIFFNDDVGLPLLNTYTINNFPNDGTVYSWRVFAGDAAGWGPGSSIWSFTNGINTLPFLKFSGNFVENDLWTFTTNNLANQVIYVFRDNLCKTGAWINEFSQAGCDPASGRNQGFDFIWEQLSLSDQYGVQIAKDKDFTLGVLSEPYYASNNVTAALSLTFTGALTRIPKGIPPISDKYYIPQTLTSPALVIAMGGQADGVSQFRMVPQDSAFIPLSFECGHGYFWRIRTRHATTGEFIRSPWSKTSSFVIKAGFRVTTPYMGPQLLAPDNGCACSCEHPVSFSWSPYKEIKSYWFELSDSSDISNPLVSEQVFNTTAYQYNGRLECNTSYFWRVRAADPAPSEWSTVFSFTTGQPAAPIPKPVTQIAGTPLWVWVIMGVYGILVVIVLVLIVKTRRDEEL